MKKRILDELDKEILKLLMDDAKISVKKIAEKVFASVPTVSGRIAEMTKNGIIKGYKTEVDTSIYADTIKCYIDIEVDTSMREDLYKFLSDSMHVISCDRVTGEYSLVVQAIFKNTHEMDLFTSSVQHYGRTKTQIVFSSIIPPRNIII